MPNATRQRAAATLLAMVALLSCGAAEVAAQAFDAADARRYNIGEVNVPAFRAGFDSATLRTKSACVSAPNRFTDGPANPATTEFDYIASLDEVFEEQELAVGARVAVKYMGVGAEVDTRYRELERSSRSFADGAIYGYFERVEPIRFLSAPRIRFNPRGQQAHDEAMRTRNMQLFYDACGDEVIVGRQRHSFVQVVSSMEMESGLDESQRDFAIEAAVKVATGVLDVSAETSVERDQRLIESFQRTRLATTIAFTGDTTCPNVTQNLESAGDFFRCFTSTEPSRRSDLRAVYTVRYADVIAGFGTLPDGGAIAHDREDDVRRILNGLELFERTLLHLKDRDPGQFAQLRTDYRRLASVFRHENACLTRFTPQCENLLARLSRHSRATDANARRLADRLIEGDRRCAINTDAARTVFPMISANGFVGCRTCGPGLYPIWIDNRRGRCGLPIGPPEDDAARYYSDDLVTEAVEMRETAGGGWQERLVERRPAHCTARGEDCGGARADALCEARGFERFRRYTTVAYPRTYYADGPPCLQPDEDDTQVLPVQCRTFALLDCACPRNHEAVGRSCVYRPPAQGGSLVLEARTEPLPDGELDIAASPAVDGEAPPPGTMFNGFRLPGEQ